MVYTVGLYLDLSALVSHASTYSDSGNKYASKFEIVTR